MPRRFRLIGTFVLLLLPTAGFAMTTKDYGFVHGARNARWEGIGKIHAEETADGLRLTTLSETGSLLTADIPDFFPSAAVISLSSPKPETVYFSWSREGARGLQVIPIELSAEASSFAFSLRSHPEWKKDLARFGMTLPPGSDVTVAGITMQHWSLLERIAFMTRSFFVFDEYRPYSINFVWGPLLAQNPHEARSLYQNLPPQELSGTLAAQRIIVLFLVILGVLTLLRGGSLRSGRFIRSAFLLLATFWIVLSLRMSAEFISWVLRDTENFVRAPAGEKTLRDRGHFYDFALTAAPLLQDRTSYVFLAQQQWPYLGNMRYFTYPSIPGFDIETDDTWVLYDRPDAGVDAEGRLTIGGESITTPGRVLLRFGEHSFVFRINP